MQLMDHEVGDDRFKLKRRGGRDGTTTAVNLDADVVDVCIVTDLLPLGDAADIARDLVG